MQNGGSSAYSYMTLGKIIEFFKPPLPHLQNVLIISCGCFPFKIIEAI